MINQLVILSNNSNNRDINLQIIKSLSEIILTIKNSTIIYYFFSNNFINQVIKNNFEKYDDDFISYYINLLKSLSLKLNEITIQFFYFKNSNSFPLLERTLLLYNHPDPMIKNVVRSIFLTFCRLNISNFNEYIQSLPCINYFIFLSYRLRDLSIFINNLAGYNKNFNEQTNYKFNYKKLKDNHDDLIDQILFLNDIFSLNNDDISNILINSLLYYYICPILIDSLIVNKKEIKNPSKKGLISPQLSLYILSFIIFNCNNEFLINIIIEFLFNKNINKDILYNYIISKPNEPLNYYFFWEQQRDNIDINYNMFINRYFSKKYLIYLCKYNGTNFKEIKSIHEKYLKFFEEDPNFDLDKNENFMSLQKEFLNKLNKKQQEELIQNQKNISIATGIKIGLSLRENQLNILNILFQKANNNGINLIRENIFNILLKSKNENILMGIITLIYISNNRKEINKKLLSSCLILNYDNWKEISKEINIEKKNIIENHIENNIDELKIKNNISEEFYNNKNNDEFIESKIEKNSEQRDNIQKNNVNIDNNNKSIINPNLNEQKIKKQNLMNYFNKYNNIEKTDYFKEYIDILLEILKIPKIYNNLIDQLIIINLKNFISSKNNESIITNEFKNNIKNILYHYLDNIFSIINNNNFITENLYENFINQWNIYCQDFNLKLKKYINETANYFLIPELSQNVEDYPFKIIEKDIDKFNQNLLTFFILNDFFLIINENSKDLIEKKCPIENPLNEYKLFSYFDLSINVKDDLIFNFKLKKKFDNSYEEMIGVIYKNILLIGKKIENKIQIKETIPIRTIELNYLEDNKLIINYNKEGKYLDKIIEFNTKEERKKIRDLLNIKRVEIKNWEISQVINYINSQIQYYKNN